MIIGQYPYPQREAATGRAFEEGAWDEGCPTDVEGRLLHHKAELIQAIDAKTQKNHSTILPLRLTMTGHECLDTIRDEEAPHQRGRSGRRQLQSIPVAGKIAALPVLGWSAMSDSLR